MINASIKVDSQSAIDALKAADPDALRPKIANAIADEDVLPALQKYPTPSRKKMEWVSEKQRRFVIAAIKTGDIQVPYSRTGATGSSYVKVPTSDGVTVRSGLPSAAYTRGSTDGPAAPYHRGTWPSHEEVAENLEADAVLTATGVIVDEIAKI